ncbi:MAG: TolC family protein [Fimbriimonadaceae bacterium]
MIAFYLAVMTSAYIQSAPVLTLEEALAIAEQSAFSIRLAQSDITTAKSNAAVVKAALGPGATLSGQTQWSEARNSGGFGQNGSNTTSTINLAVQQIIDISRVRTLQAESAQLNVKVSEFAKLGTLNELRGQVKAKYLSVLQTRELVTIQEGTVKSAQGRLEKAQIRFEAKAIPKFDVLRLESDLKKAQQDLIQATGNYRLAKQDLNNLLARPVETDFEPEALPELDKTMADPMVYVRGSLENRPEVKQAETSIEALTKNREAEQRAALPTLTLQAGHTEIIDPGFGQPDRTTSASATISVPIVTGGAIKANTQRARELEERAKILLQQLQLAVAFEVRVALTQFETAVASYESAAQNRILAEESLRLAQLRYDEQVGILLDVTIGQADLTSAQSAEVVAAYQLRLAYAALQKAVGIDDLKNLPPADSKVVKEEDK